MASPKRIGDLDAATGPATLESRRRLSESVLWDAQTTFYARQGTDAWSGDVVPHYITCNPTIADGYARAVVAFLRDCARAGRLDLAERVHLVELGSGSGRFAYLFLRRLRELLAATELESLALTLVITDFDDAKLSRLREHPSFRASIDDGSLDFARFDAAAPAPLALWESGEVLDADGVPNPLIVMANYVFDSLPADAFAIRGGHLHEALITISSAKPGASPSEPNDLDDLEIAWDIEPVGMDAVVDPGLRAAVEGYVAELDDTMFLLPTATMRCLRLLQGIAGRQPFLALVADKGHGRTIDLLGCGPPSVVTHGGCFSLMVNMDALARAVQCDGGTALTPAHRPPNLVVAAYAWTAMPVRELTRAYADHLAASGPDDAFAVRAVLRPTGVELDLDQVLALLRSSRWDPAILLEWFSPLLDLAAAATTGQRGDIRAAMDAVWDAYFPIGEPADVPLCLGLVLSAINYYAEAIRYFEHSLELHGPTANMHFASAIAHYGLRDLAAAEKHATDALALDPGFSGARNLLVTVRSEPTRTDSGAER